MMSNPFDDIRQQQEDENAIRQDSVEKMKEERVQKAAIRAQYAPFVTEVITQLRDVLYTGANVTGDGSSDNWIIWSGLHTWNYVDVNLVWEADVPHHFNVTRNVPSNIYKPVRIVESGLSRDELVKALRATLD